MTGESPKLLGKKIVTIGGGTGGFTVNKGLHAYPVYPTAICSVFDSGGSTGRLRDELGALPQGDIRRCLLALAGDKDDTLRELFTYRFEGNGSSLSDHSVGNLLLLAAEKKWGAIEGIRRISKLLDVKGQVLPVSTDDAHLYAELSDGSILTGETAIDRRDISDDRTIVRVGLTPSAFISTEAAEAIAEAEVLVFGPGDLYTSLIPNLLVKGMGEAIHVSKAKIVYVANLMTKWSETRNFTVSNFLDVLFQYGIGRDKIDVVIVNKTPIPESLLDTYLTEEKSIQIVEGDHIEERFAGKVERFVRADLLSEMGLNGGLIRHDSKKLAHTIVEL